MRRDGKDYCPLCRTAVPDQEKPDASIPSRLRLSGNHRLSIEPGHFERKMRKISDADLWAALEPGVLPLGTTEPAAAWQAHLRSKERSLRLYALTGIPGRAFLSGTEYRAELGAHPDVRADVLRQAESVARHNFGYGTFVHQFGPVVDFNHDFGPPGMKYGWHYWQWGVPLVSAYALEGNARYAEAFAELFGQWFAQRDTVAETLPDFDADVIWYELGLAVRTPVFIDALRLMAGSEAWPSASAADLLRTVVGHCRWLYQCSRRNPFHAYNWPIQTAVTLGYAGTVLVDLKEAPLWRAQADAVIEEHVRRDFMPDGGYQERTPNYTMFVLRILGAYSELLQTHQQGEAPGRTRARGIIEAVRYAKERCLSLWAELGTPLGMPPTVNDTRRSTELSRFLVESAAELDRPDYRGPAELGAVQSPPTLEGTRFPSRRSAFFPSSGFAVMRSDWTPNARYLFFNLAPWAVHTHQDILSFECFADGAALAVDPGIAEGGYGVADHAAWYRAGRGHNMLCVEDADPARHLVDVSDVKWQSAAAFDFIAATHHGYTESFGVQHRRHIVFLKPVCWVIYDRVWSDTACLRLDWFFHSPLALTANPEGWKSSSGPGLVLAAADSSRYGRQSGKGPADLEGLPGEPSRRDINWVSFRWPTSGRGGPDDIAVLLAPGREEATIRRLPPVSGEAEVPRFRVQAGGARWTVGIHAEGAEVEEA